jgi:prevent-host-death family protein
MKSMSARDAKNAFGLMIDTARAEPLLIEKHGRGVVVVVSVEEYGRLTDPKPAVKPRAGSTDRRRNRGGSGG